MSCSKEDDENFGIIQDLRISLIRPRRYIVKPCLDDEKRATVTIPSGRSIARGVRMTLDVDKLGVSSLFHPSQIYLPFVHLVPWTHGRHQSCFFDSIPHASPNVIILRLSAVLVFSVGYKEELITISACGTDDSFVSSFLILVPDLHDRNALEAGRALTTKERWQLQEWQVFDVLFQSVHGSSI